MNNIKSREYFNKCKNQEAKFKFSFQKEFIESIVRFSNAEGIKILMTIDEIFKRIDIEISTEIIQYKSFNNSPIIVLRRYKLTKEKKLTCGTKDKIEYKGSKKTGGYFVK